MTRLGPVHRRKQNAAVKRWSGPYLTAEQARRTYDRIGRIQDLQAIYEHRAIAELLAHADFEHANAVFELGYGTGALAARLLDRALPAESRYAGTDLSPKMHKLAARRLRGHQTRAELHLSDGSLHLPFADAGYDRFVAAYVLDLLSDDDIEFVFREARRLLAPDGLLCLISLTFGATFAACRVTPLWQAVWSLRPSLVGGCRPIRLADRLDTALWTTRHRAVLRSYTVNRTVPAARHGCQSRSVLLLRAGRPCGAREVSGQPEQQRVHRMEHPTYSWWYPGPGRSLRRRGAAGRQ